MLRTYQLHLLTQRKRFYGFVITFKSKAIQQTGKWETKNLHRLTSEDTKRQVTMCDVHLRTLDTITPPSVLRLGILSTHTLLYLHRKSAGLAYHADLQK